jgi:hypothetical protein
MKFIKPYQKFEKINESNSEWKVYYVYPAEEPGDGYEYVWMKKKPVSAGHPNGPEGWKNYPHRYGEQRLCDLINSVYLVISSKHDSEMVTTPCDADKEDAKERFERDKLTPINGIWGWLNLSNYDDDCDLGEMLLKEYQAQPALVAKFYAFLKDEEKESVTTAFTKAGMIDELRASSDLYSIGIF